jgi:preprotein translocase subunit SecB
MGQFIKDLSFEVPQAPEIYSFLRQNPPEIPITLDTSMRHLSGGTYEVVLKVNIEATAANRPAFIFEIAYGAVVEINESMVPNEAIHPLLLIEVPRQLFPFVRQIISDMTVNGGFPPLLLQMVDFATIYHQKYGVAGQPVEERAPPNTTIN